MGSSATHASILSFSTLSAGTGKQRWPSWIIFQEKLRCITISAEGGKKEGMWVTRTGVCVGALSMDINNEINIQIGLTVWCWYRLHKGFHCEGRSCMLKLKIHLKKKVLYFYKTFKIRTLIPSDKQPHQRRRYLISVSPEGHSVISEAAAGWRQPGTTHGTWRLREVKGEDTRTCTNSGTHRYLAPDTPVVGAQIARMRAV